MLSAADFPDIFPWMAHRPPVVGAPPAGRGPDAPTPAAMGCRAHDGQAIVSIDWPAPGTTATNEWRAIRTLDALQTLSAYGRL